MTIARLRQAWADLRDAFWVRPAAMTLAAALLAGLLVRAEGAPLPDWMAGLVYTGGAAGARDMLGTVAAATIGVAGTVFSITVAALTLASNQMGPRLLRNFTRNAGNQYALGALLATFAYALVVLRSVRDVAEGAFVPQLAISGALLLAFLCIGVLIWFLHHVATSINVDHVVALVQGDLSRALARLPRRAAGEDRPPDEAPPPPAEAAPLLAPAGGYLRVLDDAALAEWAAARDAVLHLRLRAGDFIFPGSTVGHVAPPAAREEAQAALDQALAIGNRQSAEQDLEFVVRQLVEIGLRALSPSTNDPFTAIAVLDRLGAALCELVDHTLPSGCIRHDGTPRLWRRSTDYPGLLDAMFHPLRQDGAGAAPVMIRLLEVLAEVAAVEGDPARRAALARHVELAQAAASAAAAPDAAARATLADRHRAARAALASPPGPRPSSRP
ncbi:DUF2254 domain-containing protein [Roseicella frigidaeris]|uniref:DUF2254 domain-containing protein n=1 Tax=Roseicella frigidaeris TaxID=2230885 RepID=A0A327M3C6_9PROT|nr:DUF2254 domain-containing protein [Roseicella frigidaeris]RAI57410.1 DUF2254 domain-containing protein [Roseicella frigidaeris]